MRSIKQWLKNKQESNIYDFSDKGNAVDNTIAYMLARTQSMFTYEGLPETIPARSLELYLQLNGNVCITEITNKDIERSTHKDVAPGLYAFTGGMGGELDAYYMPTIYTVANPYLNFSKNLKIDRDCIVFPSDSMYIGLLPMYQKYGTALTENELSIYVAMITLRLESIISASDDNTKKSAEKYIEDIKNGKLGIIADNKFIEESLKVTPYATTGAHNTVQNLIEMEQYLRATWFNELGLNANYNMKRESLNSTESQLNDDALLPLVDDMLKCRKEGIKKVNKMYGTNITVKLSSSWEDNEQEIELKHDEMTDENPDEIQEGDENNDESKQVD